MDVVAIADQFSRHLVTREHGTRNARSPVRERRHAVEQVRRVTRTGLDGRNCRIEIGAGMSEGYDATGGRERANQVDPAGKLRRERHDADARTGLLDDLEDLWPGKRPRDGTAMLVGRTQTFQRLRYAKFRVDEVSLEVRMQNARGGGRAGIREGMPYVADLREKGFQIVRTTGDRRRAERGHAITRQLARDLGDDSGPVQGVEPFNAVDMDVDKPGHDETAEGVDDLS